MGRAPVLRRSLLPLLLLHVVDERVYAQALAGLVDGVAAAQAAAGGGRTHPTPPQTLPALLPRSSRGASGGGPSTQRWRGAYVRAASSQHTRIEATPSLGGSGLWEAWGFRVRDWRGVPHLGGASFRD